MEFSIVPYNGDSTMKLWPHLAANAFFLKSCTSAKDTVFFYDVPGKGNGKGGSPSQPALVFIHGLGDEADSWRHLLPLLNAGGYRALALDLPGFGRSAASGKISIKKHAQAVIELLEAVFGPPPSQNRVFLIGNSMGALIAELAAIQKPGLIQGLILIDGSIPGGPSNPGLFGLFRLLFSKKWYRAFRNDPEGAWASLYPYYADLDAMPPPDKEFLRQRVMARVESSSQERAFFATQRSLLGSFCASSKFARGMRNFKGKILLVWGEKDKIIPLSSTAPFMALRPDAELEIIPGAGHLPHQEKPEKTARIIADFVERN